MQNKTIVLGVCGGIAAYKSCDLASQLTQRGARVQVVMTASATRFVTPLTFQALTQQPVHCSLWPEDHDESGVAAAVAHINLANEADAIIVAPASANCLARLAHGMADNLLSTLILATRAPVLLAPAMNPAMLGHAATQNNLQVLAGLNYQIIEPESGRMACEHVGAGRLPTTEVLITHLERALFASRDMENLRVLVTAGPTREMLDPVRYISNRSSGRMGYAIAETCAQRGAQVTLISGPTSLPCPRDVTRIDVTSAQEMQRAVETHFAQCNVFIGAAAPADYRAREVAAQKIKKNHSENLQLNLVANTDIIAAIGARKHDAQIVIGFAAETENLLENARQKLRTKNLNAIVANDVTQSDAGFDVETNRVTWIIADDAQEWPLLSKEDVARRIGDEVLRLQGRTN